MDCNVDEEKLTAEQKAEIERQEELHRADRKSVV